MAPADPLRPRESSLGSLAASRKPADYARLRVGADPAAPLPSVFGEGEPCPSGPLPTASQPLMHFPL